MILRPAEPVDAPVTRRRFPVNPTAQAIAQAEDEGVPLSVMVVDDDERFRGLARRMLAECGYTTDSEAVSVADALRQTAQRMPDAFLVDVGLPDGDGFDLVRQLTAGSSGIRVVLVSADADSATERDAHAVGALGFVAKSDLSCAVLHELLDTD